MENAFSGWLIMIDLLLILAVMIWITVIEEREDKRKEAEQSEKTEQRKKRLKRLKYDQDYNSWKDCKSEYNPVKEWRKAR